MADEASSSSLTPTVTNLEDEVFAIERLLIFLLPIGRLPTGLGFIFTNFLAAEKSLNSPSSKTSTVFDYLFWVERLACILLWYSCVGRDVGFCWDATVFLFNLSNMVYLVSNRHAIQQRFQHKHRKATPIVSEIKLEKKLVELGTQTDQVDSPNPQHEISKAKEEAKETNEVGEDLAASDYQNGDGIKIEADCRIEAIPMSGLEKVDANNAETDVNICLKQEVGRIKENGKQEVHILKVGDGDLQEKMDTSVEVQVLDFYHEKKLKELNDGWERKLEAERQLRAHVINKQIDYLDKFLLDTDGLSEQAEHIALAWQTEEQYCQRILDLATALWKNVQTQNEKERRAWVEERCLLVDKIAAYEIDRENGILNDSLDKIEKLKEEKQILLHRIAELTQDSLESRRVLALSRENFRLWIRKAVDGNLQKMAIHEEMVCKLEVEKNELTQKLQEIGALAEQRKIQLQESKEKCLVLEEENRHLAEKFEMIVQSNDFNQILQAFRVRCGELEEENRTLEAHLDAVFEMSEFYRNLLRKSDR